MSVFRVNDYITLKLVKDKTIIYIKDKEFQQCRYILLINPQNNEDQRYIHSIDEAKEKLSSDLEETIFQETITPEDLGITPEEEFWAHSSNLQAWYENKYDSDLLHSNLSFPLLKKLTEVGDLLAKKVFKKEIIKRFEESEKSLFVKTIGYLISQKYLKFLDKTETEVISFLLRNILYNLTKNDHFDDILFLLEIQILNYLKKEDLIFLFESKEINFFITVLDSVKNVEESSSVFALRKPIFHNKSVELNYNSLKKKILTVVKGNNKEHITAMIRLRLLELLRDDDLFALMENADYCLLEFILINLKSDYFISEEFDTWIHDFFKRISHIIRQYIINIIKNKDMNKFQKYIECNNYIIQLKKEDALIILNNQEIDIKKFLFEFLENQQDSWIINNFDSSFSPLFKENKKDKAKIIRNIIKEILAL